MVAFGRTRRCQVVKSPNMAVNGVLLGLVLFGVAIVVFPLLSGPAKEALDTLTNHQSKSVWTASEGDSAIDVGTFVWPRRALSPLHPPHPPRPPRAPKPPPAR